MKQKNITPYFITLAVLAFALFIQAFGYFGDSDWAYQHRTTSTVLLVINAIACFGLFGYIIKNSRH